MGVVDRLEEQTKGTLKLFDDGLGEDCEFDIGVFSVVHNGIITNYKELKALLESKGFRFETETDTDLMGVVDRLEEQTKGTLKLFDDGLGEDCEFDIGV
jgi:hypothetical protein